MAKSAGAIRAGAAYVELFVKDYIDKGLKAAQTKLKAFGTALQTAGQQLTIASAAAAVPAALALRTFAEFEQEMARVKALTKATRVEFTALEAEARRLGDTTVYTSRDAARAMSFYALAGFSVEQILKASGPTLDMAAAGLLDIAEAADIGAKIMAGMGIEADNLGYAVDVLTKAMTTANTDLRMLGDAMKYVGPIAKTAGVGFEEIVASIQMLSNAGIQGQMAGTTLRGAILSLTDPSEEAKRTMKNLRLEVADSKGNFRSLADIITDMAEATGKMGTAQRLQVIGEIFDARQAAGFAELMAQGGAQLRKFTAALKNSKGEAERIRKVLLDTLSGDIKILQSITESVGISFGKMLSTTLRGFAQWATRGVGLINEWVKAHQELARQVVVVIAGVGLLGVGLLGLGLLFTLAAKALGVLGFFLPVVTIGIKVLAAAISFILTPAGAVIAILGALVGAIIYFSGAGGAALRWLMDKFRQLGAWVSGILTGIADAIAAGDVALAAKILWLSLKQVWQEGSAALNRVWLAAKRYMLTTFTELSTGIMLAAVEVWADLKEGWIQTTTFIRGVWQRLTSFIALTWETIKNLSKKGWNYVKGLFDEDFNVSAANEAADLALVAAEQRINTERDKALGDLRKDREQRLAENKAQENQSRTVIEAMHMSQISALNEDTDKALADTRAKLEAARAELQKALGNARQKARDKWAEQPEKDKEREGILGLLGGLGKTLQEAALAAVEKVTVTGSFNAAAIRGLGAQSAQERTAAATERTAKNTDEIKKKRGAVYTS